MRLVEVIKSANANLLRNKGRSFLTILAIFIGTFTIIMTTGINTGVNGYIDQQMKGAGGEGMIQVMPKGVSELMGSSGVLGGSNEVKEYDPNKNASNLKLMTSDDLAKIQAIDGVASARTLKQINVEYIKNSSNDKKLVISVSELPSESVNIDMASGAMVDLGNGQPQIALEEKYIEPLGFSNNDDAVGKTVSVAVMNQLTQKVSELDVKVVGVMNPGVISMGRSIINEAASSQLYAAATDGMPDEYKSKAYVAVVQLTDEYSRDSNKIASVKAELKDMGYTAMTIEDTVGMIKTFFDAITVVLTIFGVIALIAASIGIINTLYMAVQERTREIGLMKAMGLGKGKIRTMFSFEAVALGFWGAVLGIAVAFAAKTVANTLAAQTFLKDLPGFTLVAFNPLMLLVITLVIMAIAFLAGTLPARKASKLDPIESLRYE